MESDNSAVVFVYGSLKRGQPLHRHLQYQQYLGTARTKPFYRLFDCGEYPALVPATAGGVSVHGEVYRVSPEVLQVLDDVEAVDEGMYARQHIDLLNPPKDTDVWAYVYLQSVAGLRNCGDQWP